MHQYDLSGGFHWSGVWSPLERLEAAETVMSWEWVRSLAKALRLAVSHRSAPARRPAASGTMWSMSTWLAAVRVFPSYSLYQVPWTARHLSS
ncbi:hypothetical protein GCM10010289_85080 [Streptomyces violascens]|nr:hypothetical protein GCM10010289_85080 [Streptomyces violascens]